MVGVLETTRLTWMGTEVAPGADTVIVPL